MIKLKGLMNEGMAPDLCKKYSFALATAYQKWVKSDSDSDYDKYQILIKKSGIPDKQRREIEHEVSSNKHFRPIDVYKFW